MHLLQYTFGWIGDAEMLGVRLTDQERQQQLALRAVAAVRQRHLQSYAAKNFKEVLRLADLHTVDHRTPVGATPLMLAARAGNLGLIDALLQRGADPAHEDDFGDLFPGAQTQTTRTPRRLRS